MKMDMRSHPQKIFLLLLLLAAWATCGYGRAAAADIQVVDPTVAYNFGGQVSFNAHLISDAPVREVLVSFRSQGSTETVVRPAQVSSDGEVSYTYEPAQDRLRAFSRIEYWFQVTSEDGQIFTSPTSAFFYEDNRFDWQTLESGPFRLHWYEGDLAFAQGVLDVAQDGLKQGQGYMDLPSPKEALNIYVYASASELRATLLLSGVSWVAGHADPDLGVIVVSLPPGPEQRLEAERQIPHELMHILLYQLLGDRYENLPAWLNEGLASINELYMNPDYQILLDSANRNESLLPLATLCQGFPNDASGALLSYAEASHFTRYLYRQFGSSGLESLVVKYADGLDCERGAEAALGLPLSQLESRWLSEAYGNAAEQRSYGEVFAWISALSIALISPFLLLFGALRRRREDTGGAGATEGVA
jgi:hypothetical protein